jgi:hypothetical protein
MRERVEKPKDSVESLLRSCNLVASDTEATKRKSKRKRPIKRKVKDREQRRKGDRERRSRKDTIVSLLRSRNSVASGSKCDKER